MYMASESDRTWLLNVQRRLYQRSWQNPDYVFQELWGLVTDPRNLRIAFARVSRNRGSRTAGVGGVTVGKIVQGIGVEAFLHPLREELRSKTFRPKPVRRVLIPKPGQPGKFRPLGIPTVTDRGVKPPNFAQVCGEPGADRKTHAGFGEGHPETSPA
jgi:RNA-directed DNA polymerase